MERPILFNTSMVRAIQEGRKTVARRAIRPQPDGRPIRMTENSCYPGCYAIEGTPRVIRPPCQTGDILWVRETWARLPASPGGHFRPNGVYYYRADEDIRPEQYKSSGWRPAIHMPKVAARIFLRVAGVQAERLREVTWESAAEEGCVNPMRFDELWDSTIKPAERHLYGWEANPWVWVITFERVDRPKPST